MTVRMVGVAGAGTMGAGIAQLGCLGGYETFLFDPDPQALQRGAESLRRNLDRGAERGRWSAAEADAAADQLRTAEAIGDLADCDLVVEAAPERLDLKRGLFAEFELACRSDAVLATNTSSLPVAEIAAEAERPERICGMHFFNPPPLMKLVEVVAAPASAEDAVAAVAEVAERMGRTPVRCVDSPGFIVNRCNRPYSLESLRMLGEGLASHAQIDRVMREDGGYRMGPFELLDLVGIDVNLAVARSFYAQRALARWQPHPLQEQMVAEGKLGRKSGHGFYEYDDEQQQPDVPMPEAPVRRAILERVVAQLVNEASFALDERVAGSAEDIDTAMRLGLNHPRGPFEWLAELGPQRIVDVLDELRATTDDERYEVAPALRARV